VTTRKSTRKTPKNATATSATTTPIRAALVEKSSLRTAVVDGFAAVEKSHRPLFEDSIRTRVADSLDLDAAIRPGHERENRWDYLLGLDDQAIVAVEPHSAEEGEIPVLIKKLEAAKDQLRPHLKTTARIQAWLWVASGKVHFVDTEKVRRQLDQKGIRFVGTKVLPKHLPKTTAR
jgi:hypothetical protein